jgi:hypothetical protein
MRAKAFILTIMFLLSVSVAFAGWGQKPEFRWNQLYRYDTRHAEHELYTNRLSAGFIYRDKQGKELFKLTPFFEARRNLDRNFWERRELGVELGRDIFSWFYLGEVIQGVWLREDYCDYTHTKRRDSAESETRLLFKCSIFSGSHIKLDGFASNEYTYDFDIGAAVRNELTGGIILPLNKNIETVVSWRHIDRIHDFDSDVIEASVTTIF